MVANLRPHGQRRGTSDVAVASTRAEQWSREFNAGAAAFGKLFVRVAGARPGARAASPALRQDSSSFPQQELVGDSLGCHPSESGVSYMWEWADVGCLEQPHLHDVGPLYVLGEAEALPHVQRRGT